MSIFGKIRDAIFGKAKAAQPQSQPQAQAQQPHNPAMPQINPAAPAQPVDVDVDAVLADLASKNGETLKADLIVLATGYKPQEVLVRQLFGEDVARRVGPIWGYGDGQELRNMYARTGQPGLWFIAGSLAQCRINSKFLSLQIKAIEEGILPRMSS